MKEYKWEQALKLHREGWTNKKIAEEMNIKPATVYAILYECGIRGGDGIPGGSRKFTEDQVREIRNFKQQGMTYIGIAEKLEVSYAAIKNICQRRTYKWVK